MKLAIFPLLFVLTTTVLAQPATDVKQVALNQEFEIKVGERVSVEGLKISFGAVAEDSRCPVDVKCVWTGNAKIILTLSKRGRRPARLNLNTGLEPKHQLYDGYDVKLVGISPSRKKDEKINRGDYVATLVVSRK
ncbi:MAG: hypothetical protein QOH63_2274 [Acidobacteriota bacterium]|jgi:hypothetical protein|nr:hypothetical protein [Acidobacteriota bacterium]